MKNLRSLLFMPGNNPGMLVSADNLGADAIIYDLEDAVSLTEKDAARDLVRHALETIPFENSYVTVRINPTDSPYWKEDLEAVLPCEPDGLVIPKASVESLREVETYIENHWKARGIDRKDCDLRFLMLVETARGITEAEQIAQASSRIDALLFGGEDYSVSMGIARTKESKELEYARFRLATAAKAFGKDAIDTPYTDVEDFDGLEADTRFVRSIGMNGRLVINPRQIPIIHDVFSPTSSELEAAQAILHAAEKAREEGLGVFSYRGKMVDKPVIDRAENLVRSAREWGMIE